MTLHTKKVVVFDLDDTLYKEIDFLISAYKEIALFIADTINVSHQTLSNEMINWYNKKKNVYESLLYKYPNLSFSKNDFLKIYRNHSPNISLLKNTRDLIELIKSFDITIGLITDGRSKQQRNKIKALDIEKYLDSIIISEEFGSEKPNDKNYLYFMNKYPAGKYFYIGDNTKKDFVTPNSLGWITICLLDDGYNIHEQDFSIEQSYLPKHKIVNLQDSWELIHTVK